ncbi:MAG: glycine cleavage system aminomethyltransferase GcvT [Caldisericia bacterium]|jgi:aminomethyltransferase|nr:glycine cleavage system aminomethyltransferase GcvT [Caldisericia bacterium]
MKKIPLHSFHEKHNAKFIEFAGFIMPLYYTSIKDEHMSVRERVGVFDVSHMGEIRIKGKNAKKFADYILTNDILNTNYKDVKYTVMLNENGGIVDDLFSYTFSDEEILLVVNAANIEKDFYHLKKYLWSGLELINESENTIEFAVQGPKAEDFLQNFTSYDLKDIKYFKFDFIEIFGEKLLISRTGYTGEDGFEIYMNKESGEKALTQILEKGKDYDIRLCGLGARDTLRFEVCYWLYGNDIDESINPIESGQKFLVNMNKENFIGKNALEKILKEGIKRKFVGIEVNGGIARHSYKIFDRNLNEIGFITSGNFSFVLNKSLALGYINLPHGEIGEEIIISDGKRNLYGKIIKKPFIKPRVKKEG